MSENNNYEGNWLGVSEEEFNAPIRLAVSRCWCEDDECAGLSYPSNYYEAPEDYRI